MKRFALVILALLAFAACEDDNPAEPPVDEWACEDLDPSAVFSWSVDPILDTLVTITVEITYPDIPCTTEMAVINWKTKSGVTFRNDGDEWAVLANGRLRNTSTLTSDDWAAHGDTLYVLWGYRTDNNSNGECEGYDELLSVACAIHYDTLSVSELLPTR